MFPGLQGGPLDHVIAAKAVAFHEAAQPEFAEYARQIVANAAALAEALAGDGPAAGVGRHRQPPHARRPAQLRRRPVGQEGPQEALDRAGISLNENTVPDDPRPPYITSGPAHRHAAVTTQGMGEPRRWPRSPPLIHAVLVARRRGRGRAVRDEVVALCSKFAPYPA